MFFFHLPRPLFPLHNTIKVISFFNFFILLFSHGSGWIFIFTLWASILVSIFSFRNDRKLNFIQRCISDVHHIFFVPQNFVPACLYLSPKPEGGRGSGNTLSRTKKIGELDEKRVSADRSITRAAPTEKLTNLCVGRFNFNSLTTRNS